MPPGCPQMRSVSVGCTNAWSSCPHSRPPSATALPPPAMAPAPTPPATPCSTSASWRGVNEPPAPPPPPGWTPGGVPWMEAGMSRRTHGRMEPQSATDGHPDPPTRRVGAWTEPGAALTDTRTDIRALDGAQGHGGGEDLCSAPQPQVGPWAQAAPRNKAGGVCNSPCWCVLGGRLWGRGGTFPPFISTCLRQKRWVWGTALYWMSCGQTDPCRGRTDRRTAQRRRPKR